MPVDGFRKGAVSTGGCESRRRGRLRTHAVVALCPFEGGSCGARPRRTHGASACRFSVRRAVAHEERPDNTLWGVGRLVNMYVLQVPGGRERATCDLLQKTLGDELVGECFVPLFESMRRVRGEWHREQRRLFPGYVFLTTPDIVRVVQRLRELPFFARVIGGHDERYVPLSAEEGAWLQALTNVETHTVEFSQGVIEGDEVKVVKGPLRGQEAKIRKIDRHKRLAFLEMHMFGRTKVVKVGLEIVSKR